MRARGGDQHAAPAVVAVDALVAEIAIDGDAFGLARLAAAVRACPWETVDGGLVSALLLLDGAGTTTAMIPVPVGDGDLAEVLARNGRVVLRRGPRRVGLPAG